MSPSGFMTPLKNQKRNVPDSTPDAHSVERKTKRDRQIEMADKVEDDPFSTRTESPLEMRRPSEARTPDVAGLTMEDKEAFGQDAQMDGIFETTGLDVLDGVAQVQSGEEKGDEEKGVEEKSGEEKDDEERGDEEKGDEEKGAEEKGAEEKGAEEKGADDIPADDGKPDSYPASLAGSDNGSLDTAAEDNLRLQFEADFEEDENEPHAYALVVPGAFFRGGMKDAILAELFKLGPEMRQHWIRRNVLRRSQSSETTAVPVDRKLPLLTRLDEYSDTGVAKAIAQEAVRVYYSENCFEAQFLDDLDDFFNSLTAENKSLVKRVRIANGDRWEKAPGKKNMAQFLDGLVDRVRGRYGCNFDVVEVPVTGKGGKVHWTSDPKRDYDTLSKS